MNCWFSVYPDGETAHVFIGNDIGCGGVHSSDLANELRALSPKRVELTINSRGGCSVTGLNLFEILRTYSTDVLIVGNCWSSAVVVAMAGKTIRIATDAKILIHPPSSYVFGCANELLDAAVEIEALTKQIETILIQRTEKSAHTIRRWLTGDNWFTANEALSAGLVDEVVEIAQPRLLCARSDASGSGDALPDSEQAFRAWLTAFGEIEVRNKEKFAQMLSSWLAIRVKQQPFEITKLK